MFFLLHYCIFQQYCIFVHIQYKFMYILKMHIYAYLVLHILCIFCAYGCIWLHMVAYGCIYLHILFLHILTLAVLGMSLRKVTSFGSNLASVTDLKEFKLHAVYGNFML